MSDPQDLLYTNNFISTDILTNSQLTQENEYYERFKNYIDNDNDDEADKYINNDLNESSPVNLNKGLNTKWPVYSNKNHYPLFDTYINDISTNRYKKEILTKVNIDSSNRDISKYTYSNKFSLPLSQVFNNIKKIVINDIIFPNVNQSITNVNNNLAWQYATTQYLVTQNVDLYIIPVPNNNNRISYNSLPNSTCPMDNLNGLVYQTHVKTGYYTIKNLIENIKLSTSQILHETNQFVEEPYMTYPKLKGTPHLFSCSIDPISSVVRFVNRIEQIKILAIQSFFPYENDFPNDDVFYYYSSNSNYVLNTDYIYITIPETDISSMVNAFPLVITDLSTNIGNIDALLINYTEFYDIQIYLTNGYTEDQLQSISYYKFIDTLTFIGHVGDNIVIKKYSRFAFKISTGNLNGNNYNPNGTTIKPGITENIIFSNTLNNVFLSNNIMNYTYINSGSIVGRALLFRWIFDMKNGEYITYEISTANEKKISLLHILAWPIPNTTLNLLTPETTASFRFVHTNYQTFILNEASLSVVKYAKINTIPSISLNLQYISNDYYFVANSYIYLKINFSTSDSISEDTQYINAVSANNLLYNQVYVDDLFFDVGIGQDYTCINNTIPLQIYKKDQSSIFAKIMLSNTPGNYDSILSNIINNNSFYTYYNSSINNVDIINIEVYDSTLKLITMTNNFSFTMEIHEVKEVLKETLINTKTNNINTTGNFI